MIAYSLTAYTLPEAPKSLIAQSNSISSAQNVEIRWSAPSGLSYTPKFNVDVSKPFSGGHFTTWLKLTGKLAQNRFVGIEGNHTVRAQVCNPAGGCSDFKTVTINYTAVPSVAGNITHTLEPLLDAYSIDNTYITWRVVEEFSQLNFEYVQIGVRAPDQSWTYYNETGNDFAIHANVDGSWCFKIAGKFNGEFGNFSAERCMTVSTPETHEISSFSGSWINTEINVDWGPVANFNNISFSALDATITDPNGVRANQSAVDALLMDNIFEPDIAGVWELCIRARNLSYGEFSCANMTAIGNNIKNGTFENDPTSKEENGDLTFKGEWTPHIETHIGAKEYVAGKMRFTSPVPDAPNTHNVDWLIYDDKREKWVTEPRIILDSMKDCNDHFNGIANKYVNEDNAFKCRKSEIEYKADNLIDPTLIADGKTMWLAYEFTLNDSEFDCEIKDGDEVLCSVHISQFHTTDSAPNSGVSPVVGVKLFRDPDINTINILADSKVYCDRSTVEADLPYCEVEGEVEQLEMNGSPDFVQRTVEDGKTYLVKIKIVWSEQLSGEVIAYIKEVGAQPGSELGTFQIFSKRIGSQAFQTLPQAEPLHYQTGLYWNGMNRNVTDIANPLKDSLGQSIPHFDLTIDDVYMVQEENQLPQKFR